MEVLIIPHHNLAEMVVRVEVDLMEVLEELETHHQYHHHKEIMELHLQLILVVEEVVPEVQVADKMADLDHHHQYLGLIQLMQEVALVEDLIQDQWEVLGLVGEDLLVLVEQIIQEVPEVQILAEEVVVHPMLAELIPEPQ